MGFLQNLEAIRTRARQKIEDGPVTTDYALNREQAVSILNEALATEIVCVLRYQFHYFMASGIHEEEHADELADLLFAVELDSDTPTRRLYFQDEMPGHSGAGQAVDSQGKG